MFSKRRNSLDQSILISSICNSFCSAFYTFAAPLIASDFFPSHDKMTGLILTYSLGILSIVSKPLGALIFSYFTSRTQPTLLAKISLFCCVCSTLLISIVPTYEYCGSFSSVLLMLFLFIKTFCVSGESSITKFLILEDKNRDDRFKSSYQYQSSAMLGIILASFCANIIFLFDLPYFSWRIFFFIASLILTIAYALRMKITNQLTYSNSQFDKKLIVSQFRNNKQNFLSIFFLSGISYITYIIPFVLINNLVPEITSMNLGQMMSVNTALLVFDMIIIIPIGKYITRYDPCYIIISTLILMLISVPTMMIFLLNASIWYILFFRIWVVFLGVVLLCPQTFYYNSLFQDSSKYLVTASASAVGGATIGKISTPFALYLWQMTGNINTIALYFGLIIFFALVVILSNNKIKTGLK